MPATIENLPAPLLKLLNEVGKVQDLAARAAAKKDIALVSAAIDEDNVVPSDQKAKAKEAMLETLKSHNDIISWFYAAPCAPRTHS